MKKNVPERKTSYEQILARTRELIPKYGSMLAATPYEAKGILNSEMLFLASCIPPEFTGRILESGRARGQSTLILSMLFPHTEILSIELNRDNASDVDTAEKRLRDLTNVQLLYGNSEMILPSMIRSGDFVLIDGPKMFRAIRLALRLLASGKTAGVFIHDMNAGKPERRFLDMSFPEAVFSDYRPFAEIAAPLDADAVQKGAPMRDLDAFEGEFGYGYGLAFLPYQPKRNYAALGALSYAYDAIERVRVMKI
jgi:hypothetical protein